MYGDCFHTCIVAGSIPLRVIYISCMSRMFRYTVECRWPKPPLFYTGYQIPARLPISSIARPPNFQHFPANFYVLSSFLFPVLFLRSTPPIYLSLSPSPLFYASSVHFFQPNPHTLSPSNFVSTRPFFTCGSVPPTSSRGPALLSSIVQYCLLWLLLLLLLLLSYCPAHLSSPPTPPPRPAQLPLILLSAPPT